MYVVDNKLSFIIGWIFATASINEIPTLMKYKVGDEEKLSNMIYKVSRLVLH